MFMLLFKQEEMEVFAHFARSVRHTSANCAEVFFISKKGKMGYLKRKEIADFFKLTEMGMLRTEERAGIFPSKTTGNGHFKYFSQEDFEKLKEYVHLSKTSKKDLIHIIINAKAPKA